MSGLRDQTETSSVLESCRHTRVPRGTTRGWGPGTWHGRDRACPCRSDCRIRDVRSHLAIRLHPHSNVSVPPLPELLHDPELVQYEHTWAEVCALWAGRVCLTRRCTGPLARPARLRA